MARMQSERLVYLLYCEDRELGDRLERLLAGLPARRVRSSEALRAPSMNTCALVVGMAECPDEELEPLLSNFGPLSPPCVVVAHLSIDSLRRLYPLRSDRLRIVWSDEARSRLVEILEEFRTVNRGPMWRLGLSLLTDNSFRPSVRATISRTCGLLDDDPFSTPAIPENSVGELAQLVGLTASTLSRYWRTEVPLRCNLKEFVSWAVLLWAVRARAWDGWGAVAAQAGIRRRTLERSFMRLARCRLAAAAEDPERVVRRFDEWVDSVWDPRSANGAQNDDGVAVAASAAEGA